MPIPVVCSVCDASYNLRDEFAGRRVKCPKCENLIDVPEPADEPEAVAEEVGGRDAAGFPEDLPDEFRRDKFLLRQKLWAIKEKYTVADEDGEPILYVERPVYLAAGCLASFVGGVIIAIGLVAAVALAGGGRGGDGGLIAGIAVGALAVLVGVIVIVMLYPKRHVLFYTDESKRALVLEVKQEQKFAFINFWYTLTDSEGQVLCRFRKNFFRGILRKWWFVHSPDGETLYSVKEDSIIMSLLRRTIGNLFEELGPLALPLVALLRTNFIFTRHGETKVLGEFNRRLTVLDRYVLDLTDDEGREIDRRVAVAMGVLLDTGERR